MTFDNQFVDNNYISQYIGKKLLEKNNMPYKALSKAVLENTGKKMSDVYILKIMTGTSKGNYENFKAIATTLGVDINDFNEIVEEAKRKEYELSSGKNIAETISIDELVKMNFRHNGIDNEEAEKEAKAIMQYIIKKYHDPK